MQQLPQSIQIEIVTVPKENNGHIGKYNGGIQMSVVMILKFRRECTKTTSLRWTSVEYRFFYFNNLVTDAGKFLILSQI
jgi:hypothetical protein